MTNRRFTFTLAVISALLLAPWWAAPVMPKENWSNLRVVQGVTPYKQNTVVLDDQIWTHARRDLGDLRLFAGSSEVPYALNVARGSTSAQRSDAKIMDLGRVNGETQFVLDMAASREYDQVELRLDGVADFVTRAQVEGLDSEKQPKGEDLGDTVLFDFTHEHLGSDFTLKFHPSTHRFLRVHLPKIAPENIQRAIAINSHVSPSIWTPDSEELSVAQEGNTTVVTWEGKGNAPVARVVFDIDPSQTNFWRDIGVLNPRGGTITNSSIHRVRIVRDGILAETDSVAVDLPNEAWSSFHLTLYNGDDPPLKIRAAKAYAFERRIYFDPIGAAVLNLFYGNPYMGAPVYGYARDFRPDPNAVIATLGPDMSNDVNPVVAGDSHGDAHTDPIDLLISQLKDPNPGVQRRAAEALGKLNDPKVVEPLIAALNDSKSNVADFAARRLGEIKDPRAVEPLIAALKSPYWDVRTFAAEALGEFKDARAVEPLIAASKDPNTRVRFDAITSLGPLKDPRAVEPMLAALGDPAPIIRLKAVVALGQLQDARAVEPLIAILSSNDLALRSAAAHALGELKDARAVEPLVAILKDSNDAIVPLGMIGSPAVEPLISILKDPDPDIHIRAAKALVRIDDSRVATVLLKALHERDLSVIAAASSFFLKRLDPDLVDTLIQAFNQFGQKAGMGENLLNSGNPKLEQVVEEWAQVHHRPIATDKSGHKYFVVMD